MAGDFSTALAYSSNVEGATFATAQDMITAAGGFKRSYSAISLATVAAGDYTTLTLSMMFSQVQLETLRLSLLPIQLQQDYKQQVL